jgi:outer membrane protein OmpA-like peptidoglycan-associated protein
MTVLAALGLGGCVNNIALDELQSTPPPGTPFQQALYQDYAFLARSFGDVGLSGYMPFDLEGSTSLSNTNNDVAGLANTFAQKAQQLARGLVVDPEPGRDNYSHNLRDRLVRALVTGRDSFPRDAARAQADYDCWMLNVMVPSQASAAAVCHRSLGVTLPRLEAEVHSTPPASDQGAPANQAAPAPQASAAPQASTPPVQQATYTVYFDFDSWVLSGEAMSVLQRAIADARAGGQPKIVVVGHTDTVGSADYNMGLSLKRAEIVRDALVDMGARREAIQISGVGKTDLAVQTGDNVREPKNRRSVITLAI